MNSPAPSGSTPLKLADFLCFAIYSANLAYGRAYNTGTGTEVSVGAMIELVRAATGTNKPVAREETRVRPEKSEVRALISDSRALRAATGWAPKVELEAGLATTIGWWRDRLARGQVRAGAHYMV